MHSASTQLKVNDSIVSFQPLEIAYPPFSTMTIVNYQNAVAEDIPFIWQKIERNLT
jgi:hypothetical protein